jgi:hypothetical protein
MQVNSTVSKAHSCVARDDMNFGTAVGLEERGASGSSKVQDPIQSSDAEITLPQTLSTTCLDSKTHAVFNQ